MRGRLSDLIVVGRPVADSDVPSPTTLNAALFEAHGVPVAGAIINKVEADALSSLTRTLERAGHEAWCVGGAVRDALRRWAGLDPAGRVEIFNALVAVLSDGAWGELEDEVRLALDTIDDM